MKRAAAVLALVVVLAGCAPTQEDKRGQWCDKQGGYIANTGWYEWSCIVDGRTVPIPSYPEDLE